MAQIADWATRRFIHGIIARRILDGDSAETACRRAARPPCVKRQTPSHALRAAPGARWPSPLRRRIARPAVLRSSNVSSLRQPIPIPAHSLCPSRQSCAELRPNTAGQYGATHAPCRNNAPRRGPPPKLSMRAMLFHHHAPGAPGLPLGGPHAAAPASKSLTIPKYYSELAPLCCTAKPVASASPPARPRTLRMPGYRNRRRRNYRSEID